MEWDGKERRSGKERRQAERRKSFRYGSRDVLIFEGITWVDAEDSPRRRTIRRKTDREQLAANILNKSY